MSCFWSVLVGLSFCSEMTSTFTVNISKILKMLTNEPHQLLSLASTLYDQMQFSQYMVFNIFFQFNPVNRNMTEWSGALTIATIFATIGASFVKKLVVYKVSRCLQTHKLTHTYTRTYVHMYVQTYIHT